MKFGILGYGYVGKATHKGLLGDGDAIIYDVADGTSKDVIYQADVVFICIPTNTDHDIDIIINEINDFKQRNKDVDIVIRSTLPLGASEKIQAEVGPITYIPEFLRERYWATDCLKRPLVVGSDAGTIPDWLASEETYQCTTREAELVKMFANNFGTIRIAFANIFYDLSNAVGANYDTVKEMFFEVQQNQSYMDVPGYDGQRGFGGKCLPKDLNFLIDTLNQYNIDSSWFEGIRSMNNNYRKDNDEPI